jgi:hypothetical protein
MADLTPTAPRVWKRMTFEQRQRAALAFWRDDSIAADQAQAVQLIAKDKKFRPKTIAGLDAEGKARHLASVGTLPEDIATRLLIVYHLAEQRPMMGAFLDALGIAHENGLIQDSDSTPDPAKLGPAVAALAAAYPATDVSLYLDTLLCHDPQTWGALAVSLRPPEAAAPATDARPRS